MINQNNITTYFNYIVVVISVVIAMIGLPSILADFPSMTVIIAVLCLLFIYTMAIVADEETNELQWTGYTRLSLLVAWLIFDISSASFIAVCGTVLAYVYVSKVSPHINKSNTPHLHVLLNNFVNSTISLFGIHLIYLALNGTSPLLDNEGVYQSYPLMVIAIVAGSLISIILVLITQKTGIERIVTDVSKYLFAEVLVILAAFVLPIIFLQRKSVV